jgi:tubulin beta
MASKRKAQFVDWIPDRLMTSVCSVCPPYKTVNMCGSSLFNSTTISQTFQRILEKYQKMYRKKAFLYQYTQEGMTEDEFHEASASLEDLISQYQ